MTCQCIEQNIFTEIRNHLAEEPKFLTVRECVFSVLPIKFKQYVFIKHNLLFFLLSDVLFFGVFCLLLKGGAVLNQLANDGLSKVKAFKYLTNDIKYHHVL